MKNNGLEYKNLKTSSTPVTIQSDQDILDNVPDKGWFIAYLFHRVVIGQIESGKFEYYHDSKIPNDVTLYNILKIKIFNEDSELFVWRTNLGGYKARLRTDGLGSEQGVVDAKQVLFGTKAEMIDQKYSILKEERGAEIILPLSEIGVKVTDIKKEIGRLCIHSRSYIGTIKETGQATYEDVRFVKFLMYKEERK